MASHETKEPEKTAETDRHRRFRIKRDALIFYTGWMGVLHQTLVADSAQALLLALFGVMLGLPAAIRADEWLQKRR